MVLIDLSPNKCRRPLAPFLVVFLVLGGLLGLLILTPHSHSELTRSVSPSTRRAMLFEEKQIVVSVLDRLEKEVPNLAMALREMKIRVIDHPTWVAEKSRPNVSMVVFDTDGMIFAISFFNADSYIQRNSLLKLVDPTQASLPLGPEELAKLRD